MNQVEAALTDEYAIVRDALYQHLAEFAAYGFEFVGATLEGSLELERFPMFRFRNQRTGMAIAISFFAARDGLNGGFTALLIKPVNRKLDVEDYLKLHGREELSKYFRYRDPKTDVRAFADAFFQMLCDLLGKELQPILTGKTFEETPIDWQGYK